MYNLPNKFDLYIENNQVKQEGTRKSLAKFTRIFLVSVLNVF